MYIMTSLHSYRHTYMFNNNTMIVRGSLIDFCGTWKQMNHVLPLVQLRSPHKAWVYPAPPTLDQRHKGGPGTSNFSSLTLCLKQPSPAFQNVPLCLAPLPHLRQSVRLALLNDLPPLAEVCTQLCSEPLPWWWAKQAQKVTPLSPHNERTKKKRSSSKGRILTAHTWTCPHALAGIS